MKDILTKEEEDLLFKFVLFGCETKDLNDATIRKLRVVFDKINAVRNQENTRH